AMRDKGNNPSSPFTELSEVHSGSGGAAAGIATMFKADSSGGEELIEGSFSGATDYALLTFSINPLNSTGPSDSDLPGDANGDNRVDGSDYVIWLNHYNQNTNEGASHGDFDGDEKVDGLDYV